MWLVTPQEFEALEKKLSVLLSRQQRRSSDMRDALSQSSETWHDNAPRDVLLDAAKVDTTLLRELTRNRTTAILQEAETDEDKIGLMTRFGLENMDTEEITYYQMTWVGNYLELSNGISHESPLGMLIFGKNFFDVITFNNQEMMIVPPEWK